MGDHYDLTRLDWTAALGASDEWERLRSDAPTETPFLAADWLETWWRHLGPGGSPAILAVRKAAEMRAIAPLYRAPIPGSGLIALRPMGRGVSDYLDLLLPPEPLERTRCLTALLDGLLARGKGWDAIDLPNLPAESPTVAELVRLAEARNLGCAVLSGYQRPGIVLEGSWDAYLRSRPGRFRYNLRSRLKRLHRLGEARFRSIVDPDEVSDVLPRLADLHAQRWANQHTSTVFSSSDRGRAFYAEACRRYAARGKLDLTALEVDGRTVAGSVGFVDHGVYYYYLPAWDPLLATYAPSSLLLAHLVERAFERGLGRFDFMLGEEPYKAQWATEERKTVRLVVGNGRAGGELATNLLAGLHRLRQRARGSVALQRARRHGVGRVRTLLRRARPRGTA